MERLEFHYDRREEITRRIQMIMRHLYYHPTVTNAFTFKKFLAGFVTFHKTCIRISSP